MGLCSDFDEERGIMFVCEEEPQVEFNYGMGDCSREGPGRRLCGIDDEHPLSTVYANRIMPGEDNPLERYYRHDAMIEKAKQEKSDDHAHEFKTVTARQRRGGAIFWAKMNSDLDVNRRARRIREALRRKGG